MYRTVGQRGPDHAKEFTVEVLIGGRTFGVGSGRSKQVAEQEAARDALLRRAPIQPTDMSLDGAAGDESMSETIDTPAPP